MNWLAKASGLILLSALCLSCENDELLSLDFNPQDENLNLSYAEFTLPYQLVQLDSIATSYTRNMLVGNYRNADFGKVVAQNYMGLSIRERSAAEEDDQLDSLVFSIARNYFYGTSTGGLQQTVSLHQLTAEILDTVTYYSTSSLAYQPQSLGQLTYTIKPGSNDTLRIKLSDALGNELLDKLKAGAAELDSSAAFREYFKGLTLVADSETSFITGFSPNSVEMTLFYSAPADTVSKEFSFAMVNIPESRSTAVPLNFNEVQYDRSGTVLADLNEPREVGLPANNQVYLQSSTGLVPRIDFQPLVEFVGASDELILLNRVVLHIGTNEVDEYTSPPAALLGYLVQEDGVSRILSEFTNANRSFFYLGMYNDQSFINAAIPGEASPMVYDSAQMAYDIKVTSFSQTLLDGFIDNSQVLLYPSDLNTNVSQLVTSGDSIKLRVYYTKFR